MDLANQRGVETDVYQPAEDSQLLAEAACDRLDERDLVLEVGTGSGYVATRIAEETGSRVIASDVNPHALEQARGDAVEPVQADLVSPFANDVFDAVVFNPPYLPTESENEWDDWMERALSGGEDGREVIDPFLDAVGRVLAPDGLVLLLVSSLTGVDEVVGRAGENGFSAVAVADESFPFETLTVLELL
ncbi:HemK2/MTQ2 family protein methyltransferase [Halostagnicola sp. A-GB9-2]|uniref:HemK2/MTQ2 family protein methyltransferase n=1 Tax=Halostagnicola sp. A-GB9-2 TaxID=3048066 RepID=UPI0024BFBEB7|nr:HemK2/MTQ2 family protein methyltransferase [Halostagnicola sp. A-GB9-2]MDJ1431784.1 class I SAM-dependent methyltransferase [Halostagnicola sp. A-GB9-2]